MGLGASAGGLKALQQFFGAFPKEPGLAFVVVQHLDPTHKSEIAELLKKRTLLPVVEVTDRQPVEVDRVYVIPPDRDLAIRNRVLYLNKPTERRGLRMPIDSFLRTLAEDQRERAVAVILSGNGTDGTQGLKAVKDAGGLTMAQDPDTAEYDGMPRSAGATRMVDFVMSVDKFPAVLMRYAQHPYARHDGGSPLLIEKAPTHLQAILGLLRARTKHDFSSYKRGTISRRIERRMSLNHVEDVEHYIKHLQSHPAEIKELFNDLLISVTSFFREPAAWQYLEQFILPKMVQERSDDAGVRAWVAGCATGEEAYSVAMLLLEAVQAADRGLNVQVFASDLDQTALEFARAGIYPESIAADIKPDRLRRFLVRTGDHSYQVIKQVREMVVFAPQNLIGDPPFSRIDLLTCRNLLIYLAPEVQRKVMALFHFALREGGYLFLGNAESVGPQTDLFKAVSKKWRIYRRIGPTRQDRLELPIGMKPGLRSDLDPTAPAIPTPSKDKLLAAAQSLVLQRFVPACALINARQEILYLFGPTETYLAQPTGMLAPDLLQWAREGLRSRLSAVLRQATQERKRATITGGLRDSNGESQMVRITVEPLNAPKEAEGLMLVVFEHLAAPATRAVAPEAEPGTEAILPQLEYELSVLREQLRTSAEQFESSNEELKSANEEMMSMNEELQSTNEELETSKEELQSLNEELSTVNGQLESKIQELEAANDDLKNLLSSTNIATIFLDRQLRIKRFTPPVTQLLSLLPTDLRRPLSDFARKFTDRTLITDVEKVLTTLTPREAEVRTESGRWYLRRILPYRTEEDRIEGVVVTFTDLTERRGAEQARAELAAIVEYSDAAIVGESLKGIVTSWNRGAQELYGYTAKEAVGRSSELIVPAERRQEASQILRQIARGESVEQLETVRVAKSGTELDLLLTISPTYDLETGELIGASSIGRDISERKQAEQQIRQAKEALEEQVAERTKQLTSINRKLQEEVTERRRSEEARQHLLDRLVTIQADERRRISRELHDEIGQQVTALSLRLGALEPGIQDQAALEKCLELLDQLGRQLHDLAVAVRPAGLEELGLVSALSSYAEEWAVQHGVKLDFHQRGLQRIRLSPAVEDAAYRIAIEALSNVSKHSGASRASVLLERRDSELRVIVEDNGKGFDVDRFRKERAADHLGVVGMEERAALLDGALTLESRPGGGGTTLYVKLPLAPAPHA
ncbi:MAG TPA: chemotaxis protein CheB [Gemmatimonadales bacterium]|nr:chemotaxis protein CheB [Gemmatimonadales bacterium]